MNCLNCGSSLATSDPRKKFCSDTCRKAHKAKASKEQAYQDLLAYHRQRIAANPGWFAEPDYYVYVRLLRHDRDFVHIRALADWSKDLKDTVLCDLEDTRVRGFVPGRHPVTCPVCQRLWADLFPPGSKGHYIRKENLE